MSSFNTKTSDAKEKKRKIYFPTLLAVVKSQALILRQVPYKRIRECARDSPVLIVIIPARHWPFAVLLWKIPIGRTPAHGNLKNRVIVPVVDATL